MKRPRIIVTRKLPEPVEAKLKEHFTVALNHNDAPFSAAKLTRALKEADGLVCSRFDLFDETILAAEGALRARIITNLDSRTDNIDLDAAEAQGIAVTSTPVDLTQPAADLTMALILSTLRGLSGAERHLRQGLWNDGDWNRWLGTGPGQKRLGIAGMGRIGRAVARRAHLGFGMDILFHDHTPDKDPGIPATACHSLGELLNEADIVSLHLPLTPDTAKIMTGRRLSLMKRGAILINTAHGDLVDQAAMMAALQNGHLAGAGLDVYAEEPGVPSELREMDSVTLLPHIGGSTIETRTEMGMAAIGSLTAFFADETTPYRVV